jgi:hypothetical protein
MRELAARAWFALSHAAGQGLRSARYASVRVVGQGDDMVVRKRRAAYAPLLIAVGDPLVRRVLDTGVRVLPQPAWESREALLHARLRGTRVRIADGTLVLPYLPGRTLAALLEDRVLGASVRDTAVALAAGALAAFHRHGFTHGDAMAENVMVDLEAGVAHWFDFETVHEPRRSVDWCRADDLRALLTTCLVRTARAERAALVALALDAYADESIVGLMVTRFASMPQRPLALHLGQAPLAYRDYREIARLLQAKP